jgi:hypothetical protein
MKIGEKTVPGKAADARSHPGDAERVPRLASQMNFDEAPGQQHGHSFVKRQGIGGRRDTAGERCKRKAVKRQSRRRNPA